MQKVRDTELVLLSRQGDVVRLCDVRNGRVFNRKVQYVGRPKIAVFQYQNSFMFLCNAQDVVPSKVRY